MAHHFSVRLATLAVAGVTALGITTAPAFANGTHPGPNDEHSSMRSNHDHNDNNDHGRRHRHDDCREFLRHHAGEENHHRKGEEHSRRWMDECNNVEHHHRHHHHGERDNGRESATNRMS